MTPSAASSEPVRVPALRDRDAWLAPSTPEQVNASVTMVLTFVQPGADAKQIATLKALVAQRGYTAAELAYATEALMYDPTLDRKVSFPDGRVTAADFERVIHAHRAMRAKLNMKLTLQDMNELIERYPSQLSVDDFGICGYTAAETPLYRYSFTGRVKDRTPNPTLELREDPGSERKGEGATTRLGELL